VAGIDKCHLCHVNRENHPGRENKWETFVVVLITVGRYLYVPCVPTGAADYKSGYPGIL
jgi:hypothetical protein